MYVIVGLGNPDGQYAKTYHNVGFQTVDMLASRWGAEFRKKKYDSMVAETMYEGEKVLLMKPTTYMNLSGKAVSGVVRGLKVPLDHVVVVYDDIDLPVGKIRYRKNGSAGTHNGMRSIIGLVGSSEFQRVRVGIGRDERMDLADYVLSNISQEKLEPIRQAQAEACDTIEKIIKGLMD